MAMCSNQIKFLFITAVCLVALPLTAVAEQAQDNGNVDDNAGIQPEVVIRDKPDRQIEEYRKGGRIVMIKITPEKGVVYYLVDTDGDGYLDTRENQLPADILIPQWKIFQWK